MARQILVPFNSQLRIKDIIAAVPEGAKPEATVVFLIPYPVDTRAWWRDHWITTESSREAVRAGRTLMERYSREGQAALANRMVAPWRYALQKVGVGVTVLVYAGSLSSVVETHSRRGEISLVVEPQNDAPPKMGLLRRSIAFLESFKAASFRSVLSLRSGH